MTEELLDVLDEEMNVIGSDTRAEVHRKGLWHRTFHCWVLLREGERRRLLFQLRDGRKDAFPGKMDASAAGHLEAGETPLDGVRELEEELGVDAGREDLRAIGVTRLVNDLGGGWMNREFCHLFLWETECSLETFRPQAGEVAGLFEADALEAAAFFRGERGALDAVGFTEDGAGKRTWERRTLTAGDFAPFSDDYNRLVGEALDAPETP